MMKIVTILLTTLLFCWHSATMASIDCKAAQSDIAQLICTDNDLRQTNARLQQLEQTTASDWSSHLQQACPTQNPFCIKQQYEQRIAELNQQNWTFQAHIHPTITPLQIKLIGHADGDMAHIEKIHIQNADGKLLQTLLIADFSQMLKKTETLWLEKGDGFKIEDVNFDGYKDLRLMEFLPAGANVPYLYWLYHPESKQFIFNKSFNRLAHITLDKDKKQIISQYRINAVEHGTDYYTVDNNKLILMRQELLTSIKNQAGELVLVELVKQRIDDELKIISQQPVE